MKAENRRATGSRYEEQAAVFLQKKGLVIRERNFRCPLGEIDIIAQEEEIFVFCEVKYRRDERAGAPEEAVDSRKQSTICKTAAWYLKQRGLPADISCRFDVVAIQGVGSSCRLRWIRNAFGGW